MLGRSVSSKSFFLSLFILLPSPWLVVVGEVGTGQCNHTDIHWQRNEVGIPETCFQLSLVEEELGDSGATALAEELSRATGLLNLKSLDLYENHIGDEGANALARALPHAHLKELYLWGNTIGNAGAESLAKALEGNNELEALILWNNNIGDRGGEALLRALDTNNRIQKIYLTGNKVSKSLLDQLKKRLSHEEVTKRKSAADARGVDCVVGDWGPYRDCEGACGKGGFQTRSRTVKTPASGGRNARPCPTLEESRACPTPPCPESRLDAFMKTCGLSDPLGAAAEARDVLGADAVEDLFVLDAEDLAEMGLKVAQRKRLIRCICDESGDRAPCCDSLGRHGTSGAVGHGHHASVDDIMRLAEVVKRGDALAAVGEDCDGALGLYDEAVKMARDMSAHNFFGEVSYKIFLVKTRCHGHRTPSRAEAEKCVGGEADGGGDGGLGAVLGNEWLVEDFRRGVAAGWTTTTGGADGSDEESAKSSEERFESPLLSMGGVASVGEGVAPSARDITAAGKRAAEEPAEALLGLHWSSWFAIFETNAESCSRRRLDKVWSKLMLRFHPDQAYRHPWSAECANLASIIISAGRELILEKTACGSRNNDFEKEDLL